MIFPDNLILVVEKNVSYKIVESSGLCE